MFTFAKFLTICCVFLLTKSNVDFKSDFKVRAAFLQQFGYLGTSETVPVGINILPEHAAARSMSGEDELDGMSEIPPTVVRKLQLYAGVEQTGVFDDETIGMMVTPRCQNPDILDESSSLTRFFLGKEGARRKRSAGWSNPKWEKLDLTFSFENTTPQNPRAVEVISSAFDAWGDCSKLSFSRVEMTQSPDIEVRFARWRHDPPQNCAFDGPAGVKAHAFYPPIGLAHFDEDEDWTDDCVLYSVALHEIGHLLGLGHSFHKTSIMFAYFNSDFVKSRCQGGSTRPLTSQDIQNIRDMYGWRSCGLAADPDPTVQPTLSEGPGKLDDYTSTATTKPEESNSTSSSSEATTAGPHTTNTYSGSIEVTFATDGPNSWRLSCGEIVENILTSPYYPNIYPNGMNCTWTIRVPPGMRAVTMHFIRFELEDGGEECVFDYLQITEEDGTAHKLCGKQTQSLTFESRNLTLNFVSDTLKQAAGFKILMIYEAAPPKPPCRAVLEEPEGVVTQDHPELDGHDECIYQINSTNSSKQILIIIKEIGEHCSKYQLLRSEEEGEESLVGSCTEDVSGVTYFTGNTFFIKFSPQEATSFAVKYYTISSEGWSGCSDSVSRDYNAEFLESGVWVPRTDESMQYLPNSDCLLYIPRHDHGKEQVIEIEGLSLEYDKTCSYDYVEVYLAEKLRAQRICGEERRIEFRTEGDTLVYFHSDNTVQSTGLSLSYRVWECLHKVGYSSRLGQDDVQLEAGCSYNFDPRQRTFACFDFKSEVSTDSGVCAGRVEIAPSRLSAYSQSEQDGPKYCSSFSSVLNRNVVKVTEGSPGVSMEYVAIDSDRECYRVIRVNSLRDQKFHFKPPKSRTCLMHFIASPGHRLILSFHSVNLKRRCPREYIKVFPGNQGCRAGRTICRVTNNVVVDSNEAFLVTFLTDRKSFYRLKVRQQRSEVRSSECPDKCAVKQAEPSTSPVVVSTSTTEGIAEQREYNLDRYNVEGSRFGGLPDGRTNRNRERG